MQVRATMNEGGLKTAIHVTVVPSWHANPIETGVRPEVILLPLSLMLLIAFMVSSYRAVQKRRLDSLYLIILDLPLAIAFACCCFFLICMYNVAFDPGWTTETSLLSPVNSASGTGNIPKFVPGPVQPWQWLPGSSSSKHIRHIPYEARVLQSSVRICVVQLLRQSLVQTIH